MDDGDGCCCSWRESFETGSGGASQMAGDMVGVVKNSVSSGVKLALVVGGGRCTGRHRFS